MKKLSEIIEALKKIDANKELMSELEAVIKAELETPYQKATNDLTKSKHDNEALSAKNMELLDQISKSKALKAFKELDPERIDDYKRVDEILKKGKVDESDEIKRLNAKIETMSKESKTLIDAKQSEYDKVLSERDKIKTEFRDHKGMSTLINLITPIVDTARGFTPEIVAKNLITRFKIQDDGTLKDAVNEVNIKTNKPTTPEETIATLREEAGFKGFFVDPSQAGSGAKGSGTIPGGGIDMTNKDGVLTAMGLK